MTYFKFNIPKFNETMETYKEIKSNYLSDIDLVYGSLDYTETAWNDATGISFKNKAKNDKYQIHNYFNYLDSLYGEAERFKSGIVNVCKSYGYKLDSTRFKFDDREMQKFRTILDKAKYLLEDSLSRISFDVSQCDLELRGMLSDFRSQVKFLINSINSLKKETDSFVNSINNEILDSKSRLNKIEKVDLDLKDMKYNCKIVDLVDNSKA